MTLERIALQVVQLILPRDLDPGPIGEQNEHALGVSRNRREARAAVLELAQDSLTRLPGILPALILIGLLLFVPPRDGDTP